MLVHRCRCNGVVGVCHIAVWRGRCRGTVLGTVSGHLLLRAERARVLDLRVISSASCLASPRACHVTSRGLARVQHPRTCFQNRHSRCICATDPEGKREEDKSRSPREKNAAEDLLQMLLPENGNNLQWSMWYRISRDFSDPDLHGERRMENDNHRHPRQDGRKDHLRDQPLHDHPYFYAAHNRRFKVMIGLDFQKNTFLMLPWVVLGIMLAVALLVSVLYTAIMFFVNSEVLNGVLWLIFGLIAVVVYTYMWLVVYSYFQQLKIEKMNKRMGPYGKPYNYRRA